MAKVLEGPGMGLMKKWGIHVPHYVVVTSVDELAKLGQANEWLKKSKLVVKAHEALGSRFKLGLVKVGLDLKGAEAATKEMIGRQVGSITVSQVIVSEMIPHKEEYYCAVKSTREGTDILVANCGGIEVESNWDRVKRLCRGSRATALGGGAREVGQGCGFYRFARQEDGRFCGQDVYLLRQRRCAVSGSEPRGPARAATANWWRLDAVTLLDGDAKFRHPDWNFAICRRIWSCLFQARNGSHGGRFSKIKGSVKFIEIPGGDTAMLPAGGGASVYYSDAVVARGGKLANYAEYSGDPPDWAVEVLTDKVCSLPGIKNIIVGGAIANFTDVKKTFGGIINGFRKAKSEGKLKDVKIWVRRGGPREKEGLDAMRALKDEGFDINVFDRNTPLTDIVDKALHKQ